MTAESPGIGKTNNPGEITFLDEVLHISISDSSDEICVAGELLAMSCSDSSVNRSRVEW